MAATFAFGEPNAVTIGFLFGALGQFLAIGALLLFHSPTIIIAGFIPLFFDNAAFGVFANRRAGAKAAMILPFFSGLIQVFGAALIATWIGLSKFGGYLGMFDWGHRMAILHGLDEDLGHRRHRGGCLNPRLDSPTRISA